LCCVVLLQPFCFTQKNCLHVDLGATVAASQLKI
jgi:hypothetical protein